VKGPGRWQGAWVRVKIAILTQPMNHTGLLNAQRDICPRFREEQAAFGPPKSIRAYPLESVTWKS